MNSQILHTLRNKLLPHQLAQLPERDEAGRIYVMQSAQLRRAALTAAAFVLALPSPAAAHLPSEFGKVALCGLFAGLVILILLVKKMWRDQAFSRPVLVLLLGLFIGSGIDWVIMPLFWPLI